MKAPLTSPCTSLKTDKIILSGELLEVKLTIPNDNSYQGSNTSHLENGRSYKLENRQIRKNQIIP